MKKGTKKSSKMAKILMLLLVVVGIISSMSASTMECGYSTISHYTSLKSLYVCEVSKDPTITTQEAATVTSVSGSHNTEKSDADVNGFTAKYRTITYFPKGLESFFKNLKAIQIFQCNLKEVHQEDLKPFPNLVELSLQYNLLEVLEEDLFDFNPDLEHIDFSYNKLVHIEPKIFDHLTKLSTIWINANICIDRFTYDSKSGVKKVIKSAQVQCINSEFSSFKEQLVNLDNDSKNLNFKKFTEKLATFEKTLKSSKFAIFRPLNSKLDALKNLKIEDFIFNLISNVDIKVSSLSDLMTNVQKNVDDIKSCKASLDGFDSVLIDLKSGQTSIKESINNVCTKASIDQVLSGQTNLKSSVDSLSTSLNVVKNDVSTSIKSLESSVCTKQSVIEIKDIQKVISDSVSNIYENSVRNQIDFDNYQSYFNASIDNLQISLQQGLTDLNALKSSQDDMNSSIGDMAAAITDLKLTINKIQDSQNDMKVQMRENIEGKLKWFGEQLSDFKIEISKELANSHQKITTKLESLLEQKLEKILEEKLNKIFIEKLTDVK
ncbi:putative leucine-rich repeat-containing protein DDB_G0290503 [Chironomus tepperi]|uniref:putative leucine-rich repeat-containing protein DDB_G0290503 n=1 Tax=Chironomus tepperi TaxID=113505 RepID=UPI00391F20E1